MTSGGGAATGPSRPAAVLVAAGVAGFAGMAVELAAVRLLAPHFGASVFVWTNVIGVVLTALAVGGFVGGRVADRRGARPVLRGALLAGGILCAAIPFAAGPIGNRLLPVDAGLRLEDAFPVLAGGSLAAAVLLFAPPVFFLGALTPAAVKAFATEGDRVGRSAGIVYAASTLGALVGTFATTHLLVPFAGVRSTYLLASGLLLGSALFLAPRRGVARAAAWLALPVAGSLAVPAGASRPPGSGEERVLERETAYQFVEVVRRGETRLLRVNEGLDSFQSLLADGTPWTGAYYDLFALAPLLGDPGPALRVLVIGLGGGTVSRLFHDVFGAERELEIVGVELDAGLLDAAREAFDLTPERHPRLRVLAGIDGRVALAALRGPFDVVVLDAYANQIHIPPHLASTEAFGGARRLLAPGGILAANIGGFGFDDPVVRALGESVAAVFRSAEGVAVRDARNVVLFARGDGELDWSRARERARDPALRALASYAAAPPVRRAFRPGTPLRDASSLLDALQIRSVWRAGLRG